MNIYYKFLCVNVILVWWQRTHLLIYTLCSLGVKVQLGTVHCSWTFLQVSQNYEILSNNGIVTEVSLDHCNIWLTGTFPHEWDLLYSHIKLFSMEGQNLISVELSTWVSKFYWLLNGDILCFLYMKTSS